MGYSLTALLDRPSARSHGSPKTHVPGSRLQERGHRYYSPGIGRWSSRDPLGEEGGENLYACVNNRPVSEVDYLGLEEVCCKKDGNTAMVDSECCSGKDKQLATISSPGSDGQKDTEGEFNPCCCFALEMWRNEWYRRKVPWDGTTNPSSDWNISWRMHQTNKKGCESITQFYLDRSYQDQSGNQHPKRYEWDFRLDYGRRGGPAGGGQYPVVPGGGVAYEPKKGSTVSLQWGTSERVCYKKSWTVQ